GDVERAGAVATGVGDGDRLGRGVTDGGDREAHRAHVGAERRVDGAGALGGEDLDGLHRRVLDLVHPGEVERAVGDHGERAGDALEGHSPGGGTDVHVVEDGGAFGLHVEDARTRDGV